MRPLTFIGLIALALLPSFTLAQYQPLVGLPGIGTDTSSFDAYIETIYAVTITVAAMLAVIKIVIAGVKYMTTDIVTSKGDAKADIRGAILGLLVVLAAVLIIEVINPDINDVNLTLTTQAPPRAPANIPTALQTAVQNIQAVCDSDPDINCVTQRCDYFDSPESLGAIGYIASPADLALNKSGCAIFCDWKGGEIVSGNLVSSGVCLYPEADPEDTQRAIIDMVLDDTSTCPSGTGCRVETCPFFRTYLRCSDWCEDGQGGELITTSFIGVAAECVIPN